MKLVPNFDSSEFDTPEPFPAELYDKRQQLAVLCQWFRDLAGVPALVTSAYRSPEHNANVGGADHSQHMAGEAADLSFLAITDRELTRRLLAAEATGDAPDYGQFIVYTDTTHVHISLGTRRDKLIGTRAKDGTRIYQRITDAASVPIGFAEPIVLFAITLTGALAWAFWR